MIVKRCASSEKKESWTLQEALKYVRSFKGKHISNPPSNYASSVSPSVTPILYGNIDFRSSSNSQVPQIRSFFSVVLRAAVMLRLFAFAMSIAAMKRQAVQPFSPEQLDLDTLHEKHHISSIELCWAQGSCPVL